VPRTVGLHASTVHLITRVNILGTETMDLQSICNMCQKVCLSCMRTTIYAAFLVPCSFVLCPLLYIASCNLSYRSNPKCPHPFYLLTLIKNAVQESMIVTVEPCDKKTMQLACTTLNIDAISFNLHSALGFKLDISALKRAFQRNVFVEVQIGGVGNEYCPPHCDSTLMPVIY
jgi:hypothetical protein